MLFLAAMGPGWSSVSRIVLSFIRRQYSGITEINQVKAARQCHWNCGSCARLQTRSVCSGVTSVGQLLALALSQPGGTGLCWPRAVLAQGQAGEPRTTLVSAGSLGCEHSVTGGAVPVRSCPA